MKILHINASYKPAWIYGGPTISVSKLCEALAATGVKVDVFTTTANGTAELDVTTNTPITIDGVNVTYFKRVTKDHTHFSPALLRKLWSTAHLYDAIHIHAWWNTVSVLSCLIAKKKKVPVVLSPRGMLSDYSFIKQNSSAKSVIHRLLGLSLLKKAFIHVTAKSEQIEIEQIVHPKGCVVISNIIELPSNTPFKQQGNELFKMIFLSRIDAKKGLDILFHALPAVSHPWHLTIVGTGDLSYIDHLKQIAKQLNIFDRISWTGFAGEEKFELLNDHDLFVLPSHNENFGNAVIESLSVGTSVLVSEHVGLADYVKEKELGWVCATTPESLSNCINDIIVNQQQILRDIRVKAPQTIHQDFDKSVLVQQYINLYQQLIANERV